MEGQLVGSAAAGAAGFSDEFAPDEPDFAKLFIPHGLPPACLRSFGKKSSLAIVD
jgi:hypothetical protein